MSRPRASQPRSRRDAGCRMTRGGRLLSFPSAAVLAVLAAILAVVLPAGAASTAAADVTGNGVGADHPGMILPVGSGALALRCGGCTYDRPGQLVRDLLAGHASDGSAIDWTGSGASLSRNSPVASAIRVLAAEEAGGIRDVVNPLGATNNCTYCAVATDRTLAGAGDGARGVVYGGRPGGQIGHVWNVINRGGAIQYVDGQTGVVPDFSRYSYFQFLRTN